jgi:hypothetical protein
MARRTTLPDALPGTRLPHLRAWLNRDVEAEPTGCSPVEPFVCALNG